MITVLLQEALKAATERNYERAHELYTTAYTLAAALAFAAESAEERAAWTLCAASCADLVNKTAQLKKARPPVIWAPTDAPEAKEEGNYWTIKVPVEVDVELLAWGEA